MRSSLLRDGDASVGNANNHKVGTLQHAYGKEEEGRPHGFATDQSGDPMDGTLFSGASPTERISSSPTPIPSSFSFDGASASIGGRAIMSSDGLFDRVFISPSGSTRIEVLLPTVLPDQPLTVSASNGGRIRRLNGPLRFVPEKSEAVRLQLSFTPTMGRGAYTIDIRQGGATVTLDFWAGETNPIGEPGPAYIPMPTTDTEIP